MKIHSPRFRAIEKALAYAKRDKLTPDEVKQLKAERSELFKQFKSQRQTFLRGGEEEGANPEQN